MKTTIYILCCTLLILLGIILLLLSKEDPVWVAIDAAILTGGITSLTFAIIRFFDDMDHNREATAITSTLSSLTDELHNVQRAIQQLSYAPQGADPDQRAVFVRHITDEFTATIR